MRLVILADTTMLEVMLRSEVEVQGWTAQWVETLSEFQKELGKGADLVLTVPHPPGANLPYIAAEVAKKKPAPKLFVAVFQGQSLEAVSETLAYIDRVLVIGSNVQESDDPKIKYCRDEQLAKLFVSELEGIQKEPGLKNEGPGPALDEPPKPLWGKKRSPAGTFARTLLMSTCPYPHEGVKTAQAILEPDTRGKQLFVDISHPKCYRPVQRCRSCNATNRSYAQYCRNCGVRLDFAQAESTLYDALVLKQHALSSPKQNINLTNAYGMIDVTRMTVIRGFLWIGGTREDGAPLLATTIAGETSRRPYPIRTKLAGPKMDKVLGIEPAELRGMPLLVITTLSGIHQMDLLPRPRVYEDALVPTANCEFHYPAIMSSGAIAALEFDLLHETYYFRAGPVRREIGTAVSELVPLGNEGAFFCTPQKLWVYDPSRNDLKSYSCSYPIDVFHRPVYHDLEQRVYVKTQNGVGYMDISDPTPSLQLRIPAGPPFAFCLNSAGDSIWIQSSAGVLCYSAYADAQQHFDSRSLMLNLPVTEIAPVERGGILFVTSRTSAGRFQTGALHPRGTGDYFPGEQFERVLLPPQFNMGSQLLAVRDSGKLCLRRYVLA